MLVIRQLTIVGGWLDKFFLGCLNVGVCLSSRFSDICSLLRARLCWGGGGSVANVSYMLHDSVWDYSFIVDIILFVRSVRWQTSCHGET